MRSSNKPFTVDEVKRAREANLVEYFEKKGYKVDPVSNKHKVRGFGGLYIINLSCYYCFSIERGGNAIECLINVLGYSFKEAVNELLGVSSNNVIIDRKDKVEYIFEMPVVSNNQRRIIAYLNKTRGIDSNVIVELIRNKRLFQEEEHGNVIFPFYDFNNNIVGAEFVGTLTNKWFKKISKNTSALSSYWLKFGSNVEKLFIYEAPIDLLSFLCLNSDNEELINNSILLSMSGLKYSVCKAFIDKFNPKKVCICVDNPAFSNVKDSIAISNFLSHFSEIEFERYLPNLKDWNDDLKKFKENEGLN